VNQSPFSFNLAVIACFSVWQ